MRIQDHSVNTDTESTKRTIEREFECSLCTRLCKFRFQNNKCERIAGFANEPRDGEDYIPSTRDGRAPEGGGMLTSRGPFRGTAECVALSPSCEKLNSVQSRRSTRNPEYSGTIQASPRACANEQWGRQLRGSREQGPRTREDEPTRCCGSLDSSDNKSGREGNLGAVRIMQRDARKA